MFTTLVNRLVLLAMLGIGLSSNANESVLVRSVESWGQPVMARTGQDGVIHLVCRKDGDLRYAASADDGVSFGSWYSLIDKRAFPEGLEFTLWDMAVGNDGKVHFALGTNAWRLKRPHEEWGFYYTSVGKESRGPTPLKNVNRRPSEGFSLAVHGDRVCAVWLADRLYLNSSNDNGVTFGKTTELDPNFNPCNCCTTASTYGQDGRLAILYREETNNERDMFLILANLETNQIVRKKVSTRSWKIDKCPMTYYSIVAEKDGYLVAWPTEGKVSVARLNREGQLLGDEVPMTATVGNRCGLQVLSNQAGEAFLAWNHEGAFHYQKLPKRLDLAGAGNFLDSEKSNSSFATDLAVAISRDGRFILFK